MPDALAVAEYIVVLAWVALTSGESRKLIPFALGSACATAAYTLIDGIGVRIGGDALAFVGATADGVILSTGRFDLKRIASDVRNAARLGGRCVYRG